jgi:hypothetical protein
MTPSKLDPMTYLKSRDITTLPTRRGRVASTFYPDLVNAFINSGQAAMDVDVAKIGRKPETVRSALTKAIRTLDAQDKVRVSMFKDEVILVAK